MIWILIPVVFPGEPGRVKMLPAGVDCDGRVPAVLNQAVWGLLACKGSGVQVSEHPMSAERQPPIFFQHFNFSVCSRKAARFVCALALMPSVQRLVAQTEAKDAAPVKADGEVIMMEAFGVEAETVKGSSGDLSNMRQKADVSIDFLSTEQFAKFSAGDAAEALIRIPGVSVAGGEFAVIRGLSDRYGNTLLNGLKVPSPDPEKQAVQMDIFPTSLIDNIVVSKSFMPNLWGDTSGGSIDMGTRLIPEGREISVSFGVKANENALNNKVPDYSTNGRNDFWGFGEKDRPEARDRSTFQVIPDYRHAPLGNKFSLSYGDRFEFGDDNVLGVTAAVVKESGVTLKSGRKTSLTTLNRRPAAFGNPAQPSTMELGILLPAGDFGASDFDQSEFENTLGFLGGMGVKFSPEHQVGATFLFSQSGIDTVEKKTFDPLSNAELGIYSWYQDSTYYRQRNITAGQIRGDHKFPQVADLKLNWAAQHVDTYQHEPNFTEATYAMNAAGQYVFSSVDGTPDVFERAWNDTDESQNSGRIDASLPFILLTNRNSELKMGVAGENSERTNAGYNEIYSRPSGSDTVASDPQSLYDDIMTGFPGAAGTSSSEAERTLTALYAMAVFELPADFKLAGGYRLERFEMTSTGIGNYGNTSAQDLLVLPNVSNILGTNAGNLDTSLDERDLLPALGLSWNPRHSVTVRDNYSRTVARPSFREVGAYFSQSFETGNLVLGNPALQPSEVENYDLRLEWRFSADKADLLAVSVFSKTIQNPIEKMLFDSATLGRFESWANNPGEAELMGFEIEARKGLGFIDDSLAPFSIGGNFTRIEAEVPVHPTTIAQLQNIVYLDPTLVPTTRRLFDQPEWIANVDLTYSDSARGTNVTLSLYAISDVLTLPGSGFPAGFDLYEKGYLRLDLGISQKLGRHWTVKLGVKNLTDPLRGLIYDPSLTSQEYARSSYRAGREYSLSATCKF